VKHRARNSKIKYEHGMIHGLREFLERDMEPLDYVQSIFPGEIKHTKGTNPGFKIRFKYTTKTGAKILAYSSSAVQEIFVVTKNPERLKEFVKAKAI